MKNISTMLLAVCSLVISSTASAAIVPGNSDDCTTGDKNTIIFDLISSDIDGTGDGLSFNCGLDFLVTSGPEGTNVIQDEPGNGGLGVDGGRGVAGDNWGMGEMLVFTFDEAVSLTNVLFNGDHSDNVSGMISITGDFGSEMLDTASFSSGDGELGEALTSSVFTFSIYQPLFVPFTIVPEFRGYIELIAFEQLTPPQEVPEPTTMLMFGLGLLGLTRFRK